MDMSGTYDHRLVALSFLVAAATSYTALDLAGRVTSASGRARAWWLGGGAIVMGFGIWSMHFVAMLAFQLPMAMSYHLPTVMMSVLVAVAASGLALFVVSRSVMSQSRFLVGGLLMGLAIASMHYVGMAGMRPRVDLRYDPAIFALSILVAVGASVTALRIAFALRGGDGRRQIPKMAGSAMVMGAAIAGMHYTGMAATTFAVTDASGMAAAVSSTSSWLGAVAIAGGTFVVLGIALLTSLVDRRSEGRVLAEVAERHRAEDALVRSEAEFRLVFARNPHPMWIHDADTLAFIEVNDALVAHYGYTRDEFLGMRIVDIVPTEERHRLSHDSEQGRTPREPFGPGKHRLADGRTIDVEVTAHTLRFRGSPATLVVAQDVTVRRTLETRLEHQAFHDPLTGLPNRRLFLSRLGHALGREGEERVGVGVLFLDLDRFKQVNDSLGHEVGDQLLTAVADRLVAGSRPRDTVARFGGDEFAVLLDGLDDSSDATRIAGRLAAELHRPFHVDGHRLVVGTSVGIALSGAAGAHAHDLLRDADIAMYRAKSRGGAGQQVFDAEMGTTATERLDREAALRRAVELGQFRLDYQPLVDLADGAIVGAEGLVRWNHPERGTMSPEEFIPLAEETGLIVPLGRWVMEEACRQGRRWQDLHPGMALEIAINLSAQQLLRPELIGDVARALDESGLRAGALTLELTESAVMQDAATSIKTLRALKALGVRLAIDDFGTGYSSLAYLKRFPVDMLKVDRAFVAGLGRNPEDSAIVAAIVTLAHALGMQVVAEGIETAEQLAGLRDLGCDLGQGYLFARPQAAPAIADLLAGISPWAVTPITAGSKLVSLTTSRRARGA